MQGMIVHVDLKKQSKRQTRLASKCLQVSVAATVRLLIIAEVHLLNDERGPVIETLVARTTRQVGAAASSWHGLACVCEFSWACQFGSVNGCWARWLAMRAGVSFLTID